MRLWIRFTPVVILCAIALSCGGGAGSGNGELTPDQAKQALRDRGFHMSPTTFRQSISRRDVEVLDLFFAAEHDVNAVDNSGIAPIMYTNDFEMAKLLVEHGADVDILDPSGRSPLWYAVERNDIETAKLFISRGASPNVAGDDNIYPLMRAASIGNVDLITLLLDNGAYTDIKDELNRTPGFFASQAGHPDILQLLIDRANPRSLQAAIEPVDFAAFGYADQDAFDRTWKIDLSDSNRPTEELLSDLCEGLDLQLRGAEALGDAFRTPVSINFEGVSPLETIERVGDQLGFYPDYEESDDPAELSELWIKTGDRRWPAVFTGPFMVALTSFPWREPLIEISVYGFGLPGARAAKSEEDLLYISEVVDADGNNLIKKREKASPKNVFGKDSGAIAVETSVGLDPSIIGKTTSVTIRGKIVAALLTKDESLPFHGMVIGASERLGAMQFTLTELPDSNPGTIPSLSFTVSGADRDFGPSRYAIAAFDEEGTRILSRGEGFTRVGSEDPILSLSISEVPAYVVINVVTDIGKIEYPFEMNDVTLAAQ
jgi:hypothetical protein